MIGLIVPPIGGYIAGLEAKTNRPSDDYGSDAFVSQPRYVYMSEMPSSRILRGIPQSDQTALFLDNGITNRSAIYEKSDLIEFTISAEELKEQKRYKRMLESLKQHNGNIVLNKYRDIFELIAKSLSGFDFSDSFVEYSVLSNMMDFSLLFQNGLELTVGKYFEEEERDVVAYSISYKNELVISNMIKLNTLKKKFDEMLVEIG